MKRDVSFYNRIGVKVFISYLFLALIPLSLSGYLNWRKVDREFESERVASLEALADLKTEKIKDFFSAVKSQMEIAQDYFYIKQNLPVVIRLAEARSHPDYEKAKKTLDSQLRTFRKISGFEDVMLVNPEGIIVYSTDENYEKDLLGEPLFDPDGKAFEEGRKGIYVGDLFIDERRGKQGFDMFITAPAFDFEKKFIGVIAFEIDLDGLYGFIQETTGLGQTGEIMLVKKMSSHAGKQMASHYAERAGEHAVFLNPLRHDTGATFARQIFFEDVNAVPVKEATGGRNGSGHWVDYRGEAVIAAWRYVPAVDWGLIVKVDEREIHAPAKHLWNSVVAFGGIVTGLIVLVSFLFTRFLARPLRLLENGAEEIGKGNLGHRIEIKTRDELEHLAGVFNQMAGNLKEAYSGLEQKIKEKTAELEMAKNRSEALLSSIGEGVFAVDREQKIVYFNRRAEEISSYDAPEVLGKPYYDVLRFVKEKDKSENTEFIRQALKGTTTKMTDDTMLLRKDGSELPVADAAAPVRDQEGKIIGAIVVFRDASQERELELARSELVSFAGHQLKAPLTYIQGNLEMLQEQKLSPEAVRLADEIERGAKEMTKLISDVLNISRIEQGRVVFKPEPAQLENIVADILRSSAPAVEERKIRVIFNKPTQPLPEILVDPQYVREVFQNVVSNAIKYTRDTVILVLERRGSAIIFSCTDNGIGIPNEEQAKIFTKFYMASNASKTGLKGTGLGLSIARALVEKMGGKIWFTSEENKGTAFYVSIPFGS